MKHAKSEHGDQRVCILLLNQVGNDFLFVSSYCCICEWNTNIRSQWEKKRSRHTICITIWRNKLHTAAQKSVRSADEENICVGDTNLVWERMCRHDPEFWPSLMTFISVDISFVFCESMYVCSAFSSSSFTSRSSRSKHWEIRTWGRTILGKSLSRPNTTRTSFLHSSLIGLRHPKPEDVFQF